MVLGLSAVFVHRHADDLDALERAFDEAKYGGISCRPYLDVTIPTLADPSLAPAGRHVMSIYVQYTPYRLRRGTWASGRGAARVPTTLEEYAPGLRGLVLGHQVVTPRDLEETYGVTGGPGANGARAILRDLAS